jgi:hypothetical protein
MVGHEAECLREQAVAGQDGNVFAEDDMTGGMSE